MGVRDEWTALTDDAEAFRTALHTTGLAADWKRYATLLTVVSAQVNERFERGTAPPLNVGYEGELSTLLRCLYCGLPRWTRCQASDADINFTTSDVSGCARFLIVSTGKHNLKGMYFNRVKRGEYLAYVAETLHPEEFAEFFGGLERIAKELGDEDASSEAIRKLVWQCWWDRKERRFSDAPNLDKLSERDLSRLLSGVTQSGAYSELSWQLVQEAKRKAGTLTDALASDLSAWEAECLRRYPHLPSQFVLPEPVQSPEPQPVPEPEPRPIPEPPPKPEPQPVPEPEPKPEPQPVPEPPPKPEPQPVPEPPPKTEPPPKPQPVQPTFQQRLRALADAWPPSDGWEFLSNVRNCFCSPDVPPGSENAYLAGLMDKLSRKVGEKPEPEAEELIYMAAQARNDGVFHALEAFYRSVEAGDAAGLSRACGPLWDACGKADAWRVRFHAERTLEAFVRLRDTVKNPIPLDIWLYIGQSKRKRYRNCFDVFAEYPNAYVLDADPAKTARESVLMKRGDICAQASDYVRTWRARQATTPEARRVGAYLREVLKELGL